MPDWIAVVILGIVEGITEFLPVSSTGHLLVAEHWLNKRSDLFNVVIQCGAVIAVIPLFWGRISKFFTRASDPKTRDYFLKFVSAFVITAIGGYLWDKKGHKLDEAPIPIGIALLVGGILFLIVEIFIRGKNLKDEITWNIAIAVGVGQLIAAVFPGASRSGSTIIFGLLLGATRPAITEFTFLVGIPTMMAAGGWKILKELRHHDPAAAPENWGMVALATVVAAIVSFIAVKWLLRYVQSHTFNAFGYYRIAVGILILIFLRSA
jgi:undecaprenyl-diphosphatase